MLYCFPAKPSHTRLIKHIHNIFLPSTSRNNIFSQLPTTDFNLSHRYKYTFREPIGQSDTKLVPASSVSQSVVLLGSVPVPVSCFVLVDLPEIHC